MQGKRVTTFLMNTDPIWRKVYRWLRDHHFDAAAEHLSRIAVDADPEHLLQSYHDYDKHRRYVI